VSANQPLNGAYPAGVIDWGTGMWWVAGPVGQFTTKSVNFANATATSATFRFLNPHRLLRVDAYNAGATSSTIRLSCGNQALSVTLAPDQRMTISTGWSAKCSSGSFASSNGSSTSFDNLVWN